MEVKNLGKNKPGGAVGHESIKLGHRRGYPLVTIQMSVGGASGVCVWLNICDRYSI